MAAEDHRHHHERRLRTDGLPPAPGALHPGDPRAGRCAAEQRRARAGRAAAGRPQRGASSPSWPRATASPTTPPTSTPPWPTRAGRSTPTSWSPRPAPRRSARRSRRARRSTPRSRPRRAWRRRWSWPRWPAPPGSRTASCTTSSTCPGLQKLRPADRLGVLRPHPVGARRVRLLGLRGRLAARAAAELELPRRGRRRDRRRHVPALELRAGEPLRSGPVGVRAGRHAHPHPRRRGGRRPTRPPPTTPPTRCSSWTAA